MSFGKGDLLYNYSWVHTKEDNPKLTGEPDHNELNRSEGYEVLYMIHKLMAAWNLMSIAAGQKIEKMIKNHPSDLRSQKHVKDWIDQNWSKY